MGDFCVIGLYEMSQREASAAFAAAFFANFFDGPVQFVCISNIELIMSSFISSIFELEN